MGSQLHIHLDSVKPGNQRETQWLEKQMKSSSQNLRSFREGDMVWLRDYLDKGKMILEIISVNCGPLTYQVIVSKRLWKHHIGQLSSRTNWTNVPLTRLITTDCI